MASKRLGRLRQWAGEMVSSKDKSDVTEEARELERDMEIRSEGLKRLYSSGAVYYRSISKKKVSDAVGDEDKLLPRDALGIVMIVHGEELEGSLYGSSLVKLGQAHCKIALAQEAFALNLQSSYLNSLESSSEEIKEYEVERRALETRRVNYDAAVVALEKVQANKKSKDRDHSLAEDEVVKAKLKYDEQAEDLRARIAAIEERGIEQLRDLTSMLDAELAFAEQYTEILRDVKRDWASQAMISQQRNQREIGPIHTFARSPNLEGTNGTQESRPPSRSVSARRRADSSAKAKQKSVEDSAVDTDSDESDADVAPARSRRSSTRSKPPSRSASRNDTRSRANSTATAREEKVDEDDKSGKHSRRPSMGKQSVDDKEGKAGRRISLATWAPSWGRKKGQNVDRELFSNLDDDMEDEHTPPVSSAVSTRSFGSTRSRKSGGGSSPVVPARPPRDADAKQLKLVCAVHDFAGAADELSFQTGDVISVVSEVLDGWWMGELASRRGLFPTTHVEEYRPNTPRLRPALPPRAGTFGGQLSPGQHLQERSHSDTGAPHPFGDEHATGNGLFSPVTSTFSGDESAAETHSLSGSVDEDAVFLMPKKAHDEREDAFGPPGEGIRQPPPPPPPRRPSSAKVPPPPPPRRTQSNAPSIESGSVPSLHSGSVDSGQRRPPSVGSSLHHSASGHSSLHHSTSAASSLSGHSDTSPSTSTNGKNPFSVRDGETGNCSAFQQKPFKAQGMCANCQRMHLDI